MTTAANLRAAEWALGLVELVMDLASNSVVSPIWSATTSNDRAVMTRAAETGQKDGTRAGSRGILVSEIYRA
jgi:hypothetical protein